MPLSEGYVVRDKYRIIRPLGEGGMARVWLAQEVNFGNREVAVKELRADLPAVDRDEFERRFSKEVEVCAALEQVKAPNIVPTYTVEPYEGSLLLVMAYMAGGDLADRIRQHGDGMPVEEALAIAQSVLEALQAAHEHPLEIIHRDIKPSNILFDAEGKAYLADFGLAQLSGVSGRSQLSGGGHPGSPLYMAPEQATSSDYLTPAADVFALGCVLFEMLTGKRYKRVRPGTPERLFRGRTFTWLNGFMSAMLVEDHHHRLRDGASVLDMLLSRDNQEPNLSGQISCYFDETTSSIPLYRGQSDFDWVTIPASEFVIGSDRDDGIGTRSLGQIPHRIFLPGFRISRVPITVAQYRRFVENTGYKTKAEDHGHSTCFIDSNWRMVLWADWQHPYGPSSNVKIKTDHPVTCVSFVDAEAFCEWAEVRLPTEEEWEKAARGSDERSWPWGDTEPNSSLCNYNSNIDDTTPVDQYEEGGSTYGVLDMAGNVWEWCTGWFDSRDTKVLRGGSYSSDANSIRCSVSLEMSADTRSSSVGFRVVDPYVA